MLQNRVALFPTRDGLGQAVEHALEQAGILDRVTPSTRIALKPNLTYPYYKQGVTTSPEVMRETLRVLRARTPHLAIVESDGGYGAWSADEAFKGHGFHALRDEFGVELVNLCNEERELITVRSKGRDYQLPLPMRLLKQTDLFITMPVPKIHCMTGLTLAFKNQWGCVPDPMRLRRHFMFDDAIVTINQHLRPAVLADGTFFLNRNGPMEGDPVRMDLIIGASDAGSFDRYVSELMRYPWQKVSHLRRAVAAGAMPEDLAQVKFNVPPDVHSRPFHLQRSLRAWIALSGFKSRFLTWFGYESWFGRVVLHGILYAIAGRPVDPKVAAPPSGHP